MLLGSPVREAYDLELEDQRIRDMYGDHIGGQSLLLARRLVEAGVPVVQAVCSAGDLAGGVAITGTRTAITSKMKTGCCRCSTAVSALLTDLEMRGARRDARGVPHRLRPHAQGQRQRRPRPSSRRVLDGVAGGGVHGGQVYGASDTKALSRQPAPAARRTSTPRSTRRWASTTTPSCTINSTGRTSSAKASRRRSSDDSAWPWLGRAGFVFCSRLVSATPTRQATQHYFHPRRRPRLGRAGLYGNRFNETPHLDQLGKRGLRFTHAYASAPVCSPYRAAFLTGQYPARVGILDYLGPTRRTGCRPITSPCRSDCAMPATPPA